MICINCGKEYFEDFRKSIKQRKLPSKYCSRSCANTKKHSFETKQKIRKSLEHSPQRFCLKCGKEINRNNKTGICRFCREPKKSRSEIMNNFRNRKKLELILLKGGKCCRCGYNKCIDALEFHHRDPSDKDFGISTALGNTSFNDLIIELEKCDLVCSNCHREIHYNIKHGDYGRVVNCA